MNKKEMYQYCLRISDIYGKKYGADLFFTYLFNTDSLIYLKALVEYNRLKNMITDFDSVKELMICDAYLEELCKNLNEFLLNNSTRETESSYEDSSMTRSLINNLCQIRSYESSSLKNTTRLETFREKVVRITTNVVVILKTFASCGITNQVITNVHSAMDFISTSINYSTMKGSYFVINETL